MLTKTLFETQVRADYGKAVEAADDEHYLNQQLMGEAPDVNMEEVEAYLEEHNAQDFVFEK